MKAMSATKIIVGLNGALQKRFILPEQDTLVSGNVHRAQSVQTGVGGKGQDVAIAMNCLSPNSPNVKLAQFVGNGASGDAVFDLLTETLGESALGLTVRTKQDTRICTSIVGFDETTELVEPSGVIEEGEMNDLMRKLENEKDVAALCIMGSMPPGCKDDTYAEIYSRTAGSKTLCLVDSVAGVESLLKQIASDSAGPTVFKINASELSNLAGCAKSSSETGGITLAELKEAIAQFKEKFSPSANALTGLAITDGGHPGYYASFSDGNVSLYKLPIPVLEPGRSLFPIGAGDAVAGGTLAAWLCLTDHINDSDITLSKRCHEILKEQFEVNCKTMSDPALNAIVSAFSFGLACGSASKFSLLPRGAYFIPQSFF
jgi:fructose-1-phosphate kinase PfkB-like protein